MLQVVGVDCATKASKVGVAVGLWEANSIELTYAYRGEGTGCMAGELPSRINRLLRRDLPVLFALATNHVGINGPSGGTVPTTTDHVAAAENNRVTRTRGHGYWSS
jgi:hypothetical protein